MAVLLIVALLGGVACAVTSASAGLAISIMTSPLGASIAVAIIACLRNLDSDAPAGRSSVDLEWIPPGLD